MELKEFALLKKYGISPIPYFIAKDEKTAIEAAEKLGYPVALKIISPQASHKTEVGGVKINIKNHVGVKLAFREFNEAIRTHDLNISGFLVQKMARKGIELIIGGKKDAQFGHMIILGFGGVYVEVFKDITARLCPITEQDVEEMINELKAHPLIRGVRGQKGVNIKTLKEIMLKVSKMLIKEDLKELDINPIIFDDKGADVVDVRFI
ncbi:MAG: acetate--CoA ligase family protein [Candidatus Micrarchaeota archaeon]